MDTHEPDASLAEEPEHTVAATAAVLKGLTDSVDGKLLRDMRVRRRLTFTRISRMSGISKDHLRQVESSEVQTVSAEVAWAYEEATGVMVEDEVLRHLCDWEHHIRHIRERVAVNMRKIREEVMRPWWVQSQAEIEEYLARLQ